MISWGTDLSRLTKCMAMALCEGLPAVLLLTHINTLLTLFKWAKPFQHIQKWVVFFFLMTCTFWSGCALFHTALTDELKMKRLFSKCTVYTNASVSLLLAMCDTCHLLVPPSLQPLRSTVASSALRPADSLPLHPPLPLASEWLISTANALVYWAALISYFPPMATFC